MSYAFSEGSGQTAAADVFGSAAIPASGQQIPWVGLAPGTAGALAPVGASNPIHVAQAIDWIQVTPTLDTSIYANGDLLFDATVITSACLTTGGRVELVSLLVLDEDDQGTAIDLYITQLSASWGSINSPPAISDANARGIQGYIPIAAADFKDLGGCRIAQPRVAQAIGVICESTGSANLYIAGVVNSGTPTYTASGIKISLGFRRA